MAINETLLTYADVQRLTGWAMGTLYAMVARRQLPHVRLGPRSVRFRESDIKKILKDEYRPTKTDGES